MHAGEFDDDLVLAQLNSSGTTSASKLMEHGFPSRAPFADIMKLYKLVLPPKLQILEPSTFCEAMLHTLKLNSDDFKIGSTKIFFRPGKFAEFDQALKSEPENLRAIADDVEKWLELSQHVIGIQRLIRGFLCRKKFRARQRGINQFKLFKEKLYQLYDTAAQLKGVKDMFLKQCKDIEQLINVYEKNVRVDCRIPAETIDKMHDDIVEKMDNYKSIVQMELTVSVVKISV